MISPNDDRPSVAPVPQAVLDAVPQAVFTVDADGALLYLNRAAQQMFAQAPESARGQTLADLIIAPESGSGSTSEGLGGPDLLAVLDQEREMSGLRSDGAQFPVAITVVESSRTPPQYTGFVRDLSATKERERQRTRMERLLNDAEELAEIGSFEVDVQTQEVRWSDALYRLYGYRPGEFEVTVDHILRRVHPDERDEFRVLTAKMFESPYPATREYRIQLDDGAIRHLVGKNRVERGEGGAPVRLFGVVQDVTEQRLTERELQAHYALTQALSEWQSFEEGVVDLLRRLGTAMDWDAASIWVRADREGSLVCRALWAPPSAELSDSEPTARGSDVPPGEEVIRRAWERTEPIGIDDLSTDLDAADRTEPLRSALRSVLLVPAVHDGETLAVLAFSGREPRRLTERLIRTASALGHELGRFLAVRRAEIGFRPLSARELEVLQLAAQGLSGPVIAEQLVISPATVKTHFEHIYEKLGVTDRAAAVAEAMRQGLIS